MNKYEYRSAGELARDLLNSIAFTAYPPIYVEYNDKQERLEDVLTDIGYGAGSR
jgi:hypothetical protein